MGLYLEPMCKGIRGKRGRQVVSECRDMNEHRNRRITSLKDPNQKGRRITDNQEIADSLCDSYHMFNANATLPEHWCWDPRCARIIPRHFHTSRFDRMSLCPVNTPRSTTRMKKASNLKMSTHLDKTGTTNSRNGSTKGRRRDATEGARDIRPSSPSSMRRYLWARYVVLYGDSARTKHKVSTRSTLHFSSDLDRSAVTYSDAYVT